MDRTAFISHAAEDSGAAVPLIKELADKLVEEQILDAHDIEKPVQGSGT